MDSSILRWACYRHRYLNSYDFSVVHVIDISIKSCSSVMMNSIRDHEENLAYYFIYQNISLNENYFSWTIISRYTYDALHIASSLFHLVGCQDFRSLGSTGNGTRTAKDGGKKVPIQAAIMEDAATKSKRTQLPLSQPGFTVSTGSENWCSQVLTKIVKPGIS
jgi:hypothetical protein